MDTNSIKLRNAVSHTNTGIVDRGVLWFGLGGLVVGGEFFDFLFGGGEVLGGFGLIGF